jgi:hypothetical protein
VEAEIHIPGNSEPYPWHVFRALQIGIGQLVLVHSEDEKLTMDAGIRRATPEEEKQGLHHEGDELVSGSWVAYAVLNSGQYHWYFCEGSGPEGHGSTFVRHLVENGQITSTSDWM